MIHCAEGATRKKVVATASRCEGVYNRAGEPSVPFCERGAATKHMKKSQPKAGIFKCSVVCCDVERETRFELATFTLGR